ncbi:MAG: alanine racemase [Alphaproteobacteria bacterium TMED87]|nr:alanine racemase [Rhodospirillaceae bacterium]OUV09159.1 MAG: alanine racemase [Alphaproteobacteria bacterium TMED87]
MLTESITKNKSKLTINLDAIVDNWLFLKSKLGKNCICAPVVKANAYGLGAKMVAKVLSLSGCSVFLVATLEEGVRLRKDLAKDFRIIVMHDHFFENEDHFLNYNLTPVLNTSKDMSAWYQFQKIKNKEFNAIIQIDTGMNRLGLSIKEFELLIENNQGLNKKNFLYIMSHLSCANRPNDPENKLQLQKFVKLIKALEIKSHRPKATLANSSGIFLGPEWHFDMVRPGAALYGINPIPEKKNMLKQVINLKTRILQIRDVNFDETVGYGASFRFDKKGKVAIVALGYANGLLRSLSKSGKAHINGIEIKLAGKVSMDLATFDVSNVPDLILQNCDWVDIISDKHEIDDLANEADTIAYELFTSLGSSVKKEYISEKFEKKL